ncbi:MAG TPA: UbiD family decarboxylase [Thermodesulfobacteriota bacterium]|nr:UbiD family decarboxylase [Thermodesulfobacteriota bacterium]
MGYRDLREWMAAFEQLGELRTVRGADWNEELGVIVDLYQRRMGLPALLFDEIKGYPPGYRVLANTLTSVRRIAVTLGLPPQTAPLELVQAWRRYARDYPTLPTRTVASGPVNEHVLTGSRVDLLKFPSPKWHEHDGGRYLGTGCLVIQKDPDSDWVNVGAYRVMVHDERTAGLYISPGKHGRQILDKYWARGEACPVVVSAGHDPMLFLVAGLEIPYGVGELEVAGGLKGEPVEVIRSEFTGLPVPATSELVIEGEIPPGELRDEGPFGEWLGYYAGGKRPAPVIRVRAIRHRDRPVILGNLPAIPPNDDTYYRGFLRAAAVWEQLEAAGVAGVKGVWCHESGGGRMFLVVAIEQRYPGHARQAGLIASQCHAGAYANRYTVVVDDDIDPTNTDQVLWAMCSRVDPAVDIEIVQRCWSTSLDPMSYPRDNPVFNNRVVIDACRPWDRRDSFPKVVEASPQRKREVIEKWRHLLPEIAD